MREIWILGSCPPPYGGVATFVSSLHECLLRDGIKHHMIVRSEKRHRGMLLLEKNIFKYFLQMMRIKSSSYVIDSCNIFLEYPQFMENKQKFLVWNLIVKLKRLKWIKIFHDGTLPNRYRDFGYAEKLILKYSLSNMEKVLVVDESIRSWLIQDAGYKRRIKVVKSMLPKEYRKCHLPANIEQFILKHKYILVSTGTCREEYGFLNIIAAIERLPEEYQKEIGLILIDGNFAGKDKVYLKTRNKIVGTRNVLLLTNGIENDMVHAIMKRCTVFIRGFQYESYGISRIEAILAGIPVIATNVGETRGMYTYEYGDIEKLSRLILQTLINPIVENNEWKHFYQNEIRKNYNLIKEELMKD